jgi:hypothetical protein
MRLSKSIWASATFSALMLSGAMAGVPAEQAARLGKDLTPVGAEKAGNADGSIPAWTGGLTTIPEGLSKPYGHYSDPFAGDQILFTITKDNLATHEASLTPGQRGMLETYPGYKLNVFRRIAVVRCRRVCTRRHGRMPSEALSVARATALTASCAAYHFPFLPAPMKSPGITICDIAGTRFPGHSFQRRRPATERSRRSRCAMNLFSIIPRREFRRSTN